MGCCLEAADGEPDFESCPGVPAPACKLIAVVTRSGRLIGDEAEPELDFGVEVTVGPDTDPWADSIDEPDGPTGLAVRLDTSEMAQESPVPGPDEGEAASPTTARTAQRGTSPRRKSPLTTMPSRVMGRTTCGPTT
jgi:hypothetical protein